MVTVYLIAGGFLQYREGRLIDPGGLPCYRRIVTIAAPWATGGPLGYTQYGVSSVEKSWANIIESIGEDLERPGLVDTPRRAAKAFAFLTRGYQQSVEEVVNDALFPSDSSEMILVQDVEMYSLCEHHLLPFIGKCHVAYIPTGKVLGLSKVARIVDVFARRLQIQESLTSQIAQTIMEVTDAQGVGVIIEAQHMCMMMRGVEKQNSLMKTSAMLGTFRSEQKTREEFLALLQMKR
jgi:GTP cyclohydrolase I